VTECSVIIITIIIIIVGADFYTNDTMSVSLDLDLDDVCSFIHFLCNSRFHDK